MHCYHHLWMMTIATYNPIYSAVYTFILSISNSLSIIVRLKTTVWQSIDENSNIPKCSLISHAIPQMIC